MKVSGRRQKKNRSRPRVIRARVVELFEIEYPALMAAAIAGVAFHGSDGGPCDCWGDSVRWVALPFTMEQLDHQSAAQRSSSFMEGLIHQGVVPPSNI